ncbi:MAG: monovalent cation/H+ antiporter complex subunit F [Roseitalea porphyridii]|jgi:multicomponent Na+:H+ antiporter subunit F|uniref:monovalent cation/H+ antiporter complex subunit F n=1 Tax=Roseitalea porphyridii TaxID=1852022 RepID=UPI0032EEAA3A
MTAWILASATILLGAAAAALLRVARGPEPADRMMGAQLVGTTGVAVVVLLAVDTGDWALLDVAIVLSLLSAFASIAFIKAASSDGQGDPEEDT